MRNDDDSIRAQAESAGVGDLARALSAPARPDELAGREDALRAFRQEMLSEPSRPRQMWRPPMPTKVLRLKLGASVAGFAIGIAAAGVVAIGVSTPSLQNAAQGTELPVVTTTTATTTATASASETTAGMETESTETAGTETAAPETEAPETKAPETKAPETKAPDTEESATGPDATGPAAYGLCNAWSNHQRNGAEPTGSVAFRNLAEAAGGEDEIEAYCETVEHPSDQDRAAAPEEESGATDDAPKPAKAKDKSGKNPGTKSPGKKSAKRAG